MNCTDLSSTGHQPMSELVSLDRLHHPSVDSLASWNQVGFENDDRESFVSHTELPIPLLVDNEVILEHDQLSDQWDSNEAQDDTVPVEAIPVDTVQNSVDDEVIQSAMLRNERSLKSFTMPWERGMAAKVFNTASITSMRTWPYQKLSLGRADFIHDVAHRQSTSTSSNSANITRPVLPFALRKLRVTQIQTDPDILRQRSINIWRVVIEDDLSMTAIGVTLQHLCVDLSKEDDIQRTLLDVFAPKSTATLYKRGREMLAFVQWYRSNNLNGSPLAFEEMHLYSYMNHLRSIRAGPTRGNSFLQAVRFTHALLGCKSGSIEHSISARIKGASYNMYLLKRPLKQALPLSVEEVKVLEDTVLFGKNPHDRIAAGFMLFCVLSSARVSDAQNITRIRIQKFDSTCILECDSLRHKTAYTCEKKTTFLPYLCLGSVFRRESWAEAWLEARQQSDIQDTDWALPAPDFNGSWHPRKSTTGEVTQWLRDILVSSGIDNQRTDLLTSHGFKCTVLSWAAKFGVDMQTRRILGHHVDPESKSALTYSRDALIAAHICVADMLSVISSGGFNPDMSRAERLHRHLHPISVEIQGNQQPVPVEEELEQTELVTNESSSDDDIEHVDTAVQESMQLWQSLDDTNAIAPLAKSKVKYVQHVISGCMHIAHPELVGTLLCGRMITFNYREALKHDPLSWTLCGQCQSANQD